MNDDMLAIGEVARRLELSVEKIRKLAASGELRCQRTPGGHRRFREDDVAAYEGGIVVTQRKPTQPRGTRRRPPKRRVPYIPIFDDFPEECEILDEDGSMVLEAPAQHPIPHVANTEVQRVIRVSPPGHDEREAKREQEKNHRQSIEAERRLQALKQRGLASIPWDIPGTWRARVLADLERYVTAENFPSWTSSYDQLNMVNARVEDVLQPYHDQQAKEQERRKAEASRARAEAERKKAEAEREAAQRRAEVEAQQKIRNLVSHGRFYATRMLWSIDVGDRFRIRSDIEKALSEEVEQDWTNRDVEELVDEVLEEWVEI